MLPLHRRSNVPKSTLFRNGALLDGMRAVSMPVSMFCQVSTSTAKIRKERLVMVVCASTWANPIRLSAFRETLNTYEAAPFPKTQFVAGRPSLAALLRYLVVASVSPSALVVDRKLSERNLESHTGNDRRDSEKRSRH